MIGPCIYHQKSNINHNKIVEVVIIILEEILLIETSEIEVKTGEKVRGHLKRRSILMITSWMKVHERQVGFT